MNDDFEMTLEEYLQVMEELARANGEPVEQYKPWEVFDDATF